MSTSKLQPFTTPFNLNTLYLQSNSWFRYFVKCLNLFYFPYAVSHSLNGLIFYFTLNNRYTLSLVSYPAVVTTLQPFFNNNFSKKNTGYNVKISSLNHIKTLSLDVNRSKTINRYKGNGPTYTDHFRFMFFKKHFIKGVLPLYSPFVKKKNRSFSFISKLFTKKSLKAPRFTKKLMAHRKLWFLATILNLNKKIKLFNFSKNTPFRRFLKTLRTRKESLLKRKNYLIPRQYAFLNGARFSVKGKKSIKVVLLRRLVRFYRKKLRRMNTTTYSSAIGSKNLKYKFHLLTLSKRQGYFNIASLFDSKFHRSDLSLTKLIRRGTSRVKLRRTKKYYSFLTKIITMFSSNPFLINLKKQYQFSRTRYLSRFFRNHPHRYKLNVMSKLLAVQSLSKISTSNWFIQGSHSPVFSTHEYEGVCYYSEGQITNIKTHYLVSSFYKKFSSISQNPSPTSLTFNNDVRSTFSSFESPAILSKYKAPLLLSTVGFVFIQNIYNQTSTYIKSNLNKFRYSFFFKKDLKRYLLKKPGKLKLLTSSLLFSNYRRREPITHQLTSNLQVFNTSTLNLDANSLMSTHNLLTSQNPFFSYKYCRQYDSFLGNFFKKEVRMKRIKFRPGYSRIWRSARQAINTSLSLNTRYQYRLTRQLYRIQHLTKQTQAFIFDLTLKNLLLNSRFVHDHNTSLLMIQNGLVFVNGLTASNPNLNLFQNDFIQIIISLKYYIVYRWLMNWNASKRIRLRKLSKTKFKKFKVMTNKQRSQNLPDWVLTSRLKSFDIPKYLEVDFFSLSSFVLYEPFVANDLNSLNFLDSRSEILNMYNWKYIN